MRGVENVFLVAVAAGVVWAVRAYFWPMAPCRRCQGRKTNRGSGKRRFGSCKRCGGSGTRQVLGSRTVHRTTRALLAYQRKGRQR